MPPQNQDGKLSDVVDLFPEELGEPEVRLRLRKFVDALDGLLVLDEAGELALDPDALSRIAQDRDLIPAEQQDLLVRETRSTSARS
jgi:hypothetical protein